MSEFKTVRNYFFSDGFPIKIDYSLFQLDAYRLLCYFSSSMQIKKISETFEHTDVLLTIRNEYDKSEISRTLLNLAIIARNELDNSNQIYPAITDESTQVGILFPNIKKTTKKALTFREACNKIIHMKRICWDLWNAKSIIEYDYLKPKIYLYGKKDPFSWKAIIDVYKYIYVCLNLFMN